jgi:hypothetical protein
VACDTGGFPKQGRVPAGRVSMPADRNISGNHISRDDLLCACALPQEAYESPSRNKSPSRKQQALRKGRWKSPIIATKLRVETLKRDVKSGMLAVSSTDPSLGPEEEEEPEETLAEKERKKLIRQQTWRRMVRRPPPPAYSKSELGFGMAENGP